MAELATRLATWGRGGRPLLMSEFGDWGLPDLDGGRWRFWSYGDRLAGSSRRRRGRPATPISSRVRSATRDWRTGSRSSCPSVAGVIGWCVTELTDVHKSSTASWTCAGSPRGRRAMRSAVPPTASCPVFVRSHWSVAVGQDLVGDVVVVNDGPAVEGRRGAGHDSRPPMVRELDLPAYGEAPRRPGPPRSGLARRPTARTGSSSWRPTSWRQLLSRPGPAPCPPARPVWVAGAGAVIIGGPPNHGRRRRGRRFESQARARPVGHRRRPPERYSRGPSTSGSGPVATSSSWHRAVAVTSPSPFRCSW